MKAVFVEMSEHQVDMRGRSDQHLTVNNTALSGVPMLLCVGCCKASILLKLSYTRQLALAQGLPMKWVDKRFKMLGSRL